jgi:hypothetical protein
MSTRTRDLTPSPRMPAGITSNEHFRIIPPKPLRGTSTASKLTEAFPNSRAWVGNHWFQRYPLLLVETPVCAKGTSFAQQHRQGSRVEILCSNSGISHHNHAGVICTYTAIFPDLVCDRTTIVQISASASYRPRQHCQKGAGLRPISESVWWFPVIISRISCFVSASLRCENERCSSSLVSR